jgi:hypothetical protein
LLLDRWNAQLFRSHFPGSRSAAMIVQSAMRKSLSAVLVLMNSSDDYNLDDVCMISVTIRLSTDCYLDDIYSIPSAAESSSLALASTSR